MNNFWKFLHSKKNEAYIKWSLREGWGESFTQKEKREREVDISCREKKERHHSFERKGREKF